MVELNLKVSIFYFPEAIFHFHNSHLIATPDHLRSLSPSPLLSPPLPSPPLHTALSMPIPCIRGPDDHPMECVIVPANIIPYLNFNVTEVVELVNQTHFFPENNPFLREFEKFLEDNATSCDQLTLYNLPHYYYVK